MKLSQNMAKRLNQALQQILSSENRLDIRNIKYLPRWAILGIDITIVISAAFLTVLALRDLTSHFYNLLPVSQRMLLVVGVNIFFFFIFRTYAGLIRHSSYLDALKIMLAGFSTFISLLMINYLSYFFIGEKIFLVAGLIFYFQFPFRCYFFSGYL